VSPLSDPDTAKSEPDWEAVRADYEDSILTLPAIYERHGITLAQVRVARRQFGWRPRNRPSPPLRTDLIDRLFKILKRQIRHMETEKTAGGDKEAALLGSLARNLEKLIALQDAEKGTRTNANKAAEMADLRKRLVQRIGELKRR
jgi:hypothetical protein